MVCPSWVATEFHETQMNKEGVPRGPRGRAYYNSRTMTAARCAELTLKAAYNRRRELLMGPGALAVLLKAIAPGFVDWLAIKMFLEPAIRRAKMAGIKVKSRV